MRSKSMRFLLVFVFALLSTGAFAVSSVRRLGVNNADASSTVTSPIRNVANISTTKRATLPLKTIKTSGTTTSNNDVTDSSGNRLSVIKKLNINTPVATTWGQGTSGNGLISDISKQAAAQGNASNANAAAVSEILTKLDELEERLEGIDLSNYYTKPEIDEQELQFYTTGQVDIKIDEINDALADKLSNEYYTAEALDNKLTEIQHSLDDISVNTSAETVAQHTVQIQQLQNQYNTIVGSYVTIRDEGGQSLHDVSVVDSFDEQTFQWEL